MPRIAFFDARAIAGVEDGDSLASWADSVGGVVASQANAPAQPIYRASGLSTYPAVEFSTSRYLENATTNLLTADGARTVVVVGRSSVAAGGTLFTFRRSAALFVCQSLTLVNGHFVYTDGAVAANNATVPNPGAELAGRFVSVHRTAGAGSKIRYRLNGSNRAVTQSGSVATLTGAAGFTVGGRADEPSLGWSGVIAEIHVYDEDLSDAALAALEAEIAARYAPAPSDTYSAAVLQDIPLVYARLNEPGGSVLHDSSGHYRHGTYTGGVTLGTPGLVAGSADPAATFNGSDAQGTVPYGAWMPGGSMPFTAEAICGPLPTTGGRRIVLSRGSLGFEAHFHITYDPLTFEWKLWLYRGDAPEYWIAGYVLAVAERGCSKYHVAATFDGATGRLYLQGAQKASVAGGALRNPNHDFRVAAGYIETASLEGWWLGIIDEVALYGAALSAGRIAAHASAMGSPSCGCVPATAEVWEVE
jgi:hypothetical protein